MVPIDFDRVIDRRGTNSLKWDFSVERGHPAGALPLWVADMDFPAPGCVREAVHRAADHGIFGYSEVKQSYYEAAAAWFETRHHWRPEAEWLVKTPGVVYALAMAVQALTRPGDSVLIQTPVYYPFHEVIRDNGRRIADSPLCLADGHYEIDFDDLERVVIRERVKLFLLCSPHNPVGRVWTAGELRRLGEICLRHGTYVVSDEIHCDLTLPGHPHTVFLNAVPEMREKTVLCTSASKSFNLAGLQVSSIWIPGREVRDAFQRRIAASGYSQLNQIGLIATEAAYRDGADWLDRCREYLAGNLAFFRRTLQDRLPQLRLIEPEGTYFAWVDFSALGLTAEQLNRLVSGRANLWLDAGIIFGESGGQFQRFVLATQRAVLDRALAQLRTAVMHEGID